jgi:ParB family chromosome partitioning protein
MTHQQVADALGLSRPVVSNALRLLDLAMPVRTLLQNQQLDAGHARALATLPVEQQIELAEKISAKALTVRQVESMVRKLSEPAPAKTPEGKTDPDTDALVRKMTDALGLPVELKRTESGRGVVSLRFSDAEQLELILRRLLVDN